MDASSLTAFDIAVLTLIGLSTLFAFGKGFTTVALSFAAWIGAFAAVIFGMTFVEPYAQDLIQPPELANFIAIIILFFLTLFVLKQIAGLVGGMVKSGPIGFLDRSLGALFGLLRGMVIVSLMYFGYSKIFPSSEVDWINNARTKPLVAWGAEMLEGYAAEALGRDPTTVGSEYIEKAADAVPSQFINEKLEEQAAKYVEEQRKELDALVDDLAKKKQKKDDGT